MYVYSWFIVLRESLLTVRLAVSEIKPVQSLTDRQTDRLTDRNVNYSNSRCACARGLIMFYTTNITLLNQKMHAELYTSYQVCGYKYSWTGCGRASSWEGGGSGPPQIAAECMASHAPPPPPAPGRAQERERGFNTASMISLTVTLEPIH